MKLRWKILIVLATVVCALAAFLLLRPAGSEQKALEETRQSLRKEGFKTDLTEFNFFVITLTIQRETGGNLGETLENLSDMLRKRRQVKLKVKALSSEAKASAIIIGSLPFVLFGILYLLNQEYVMTLFTHPKGIWLVGIGFGMLGTGVGVMAKMVRFEI